MHMKPAFDDGSQRIDPEAEICIACLSLCVDKQAEQICAGGCKQDMERCKAERRWD